MHLTVSSDWVAAPPKLVLEVVLTTLVVPAAAGPLLSWWWGWLTGAHILTGQISHNSYGATMFRSGLT